jgi:hypothetical protein
MDFVLIDTSNGAKTTNGEQLTPENLGIAAQLCTIFLNRDVSPEHGGTHNVRAGTSITDVLPNECPVDSQSTLVGAPGAIAYHDVTANGAPEAYDGVTLSDSLFGSGNSWLVAITHELAETVADAGCNEVAIDSDGTAKAYEVCDPVEEECYEIQIPNGPSGYVSNFVTKEYFIPNHPGPYDFMNKTGRTTTPPAGPMQVAPSGGANYQIVYSGVGSSSQVTGKMSSKVSYKGNLGHRTAKKKHPLSRTSRRGLSVK